MSEDVKNKEEEETDGENQREKSKYEKQNRKWKKAKKKMWKDMVLALASIYIVSVAFGYLMGLPTFYVARTVFFGVVLMMMSFLSGVHVKGKIEKHRIPPEAQELTPEMKEEIELDEEE